MRMETLLTHELGWFEHFNHPDKALVPSLLHCVLYVVEPSLDVLFSSLL